jgi:hypothetical protein
MMYASLRLPLDKKTAAVTANGRPAQLARTHKEIVVTATVTTASSR